MLVLLFFLSFSLVNANLVCVNDTCKVAPEEIIFEVPDSVELEVATVDFLFKCTRFLLGMRYEEFFDFEGEMLFGKVAVVKHSEDLISPVNSAMLSYLERISAGLERAITFPASEVRKRVAEILDALIQCKTNKR